MAKRLRRRDQLYLAYQEYSYRSMIEDHENEGADRYGRLADKAYALLNEHFPVKRHPHRPGTEDDAVNLVGDYRP